MRFTPVFLLGIFFCFAMTANVFAQEDPTPTATPTETPTVEPTATPVPELTYKKVRKNKTLKLANCPLVDGVNRVLIVQNGSYVQLPPAQKRGAYKLPRSYKFFACADRGDGRHVIYAKIKANTAPRQFALSLRNFPKNQVGRHCPVVYSWNASLIYKTIGSGHFYDCRRNAIGLIARAGYRGPVPGRIPLYDRAGNEVGAVALYSRGGGEWAARWYACIGGTPNRNGAAVAAIARRNTGSSDVYFGFGSFCYGPVPADRCIGSQQC